MYILYINKNKNKKQKLPSINNVPLLPTEGYLLPALGWVRFGVESAPVSMMTCLDNEINATFAINGPLPATIIILRVP